MAVVFGHILLFVVLQPLSTVLEAGSLSRRQLVVLDAIRDPALLIRFALMDLIHARMAGTDLAERAPEVLELWAEADPIHNRATRRQDEQGRRNFGCHAMLNPCGGV